MTKIKLIGLFVMAMFCLPATGQEAKAEEQADLNRQSLIAARAGDFDLLKHLIERGAAVNTRNRFGDTLLLLAIKGERLGMMRFLVRNGADVNLANVAKVTPLMAAAISGRKDMA